MLKTTSPLHTSKSQVMTEEASMISISSWLEERKVGGRRQTVIKTCFRRERQELNSSTENHFSNVSCSLIFLYTHLFFNRTNQDSTHCGSEPCTFYFCPSYQCSGLFHVAPHLSISSMRHNREICEKQRTSVCDEDRIITMTSKLLPEG